MGHLPQQPPPPRSWNYSQSAAIVSSCDLTLHCLGSRLNNNESSSSATSSSSSSEELELLTECCDSECLWPYLPFFRIKTQQQWVIFLSNLFLLLVLQDWNYSQSAATVSACDLTFHSLGSRLNNNESSSSATSSSSSSSEELELLTECCDSECLWRLRRHNASYHLPAGSTLILVHAGKYQCMGESSTFPKSWT